MSDEEIIQAAAELDGRDHCPNCPDQGWYVVEHGGCGPDGENDTRECSQEQCQWCNEEPNSIYNAPPYLTSTDAALRLVDKMRADGWRVMLNNGLDGSWECEIFRPTTGETHLEDMATIQGYNAPVELHYSPDNSLARAITIACLKAAGKLTI